MSYSKILTVFMVTTMLILASIKTGLLNGTPVPPPCLTETPLSAAPEPLQEINALKDRINTNLRELNRLVISFAGDCTLGTDPSFTYHNSFPYQFEIVNRDYSYFFKNVKWIFGTDHLTLVNLETTFTRSNNRISKKFNFKGDPSCVNILKAGCIEAVNISNNHIYDYGIVGFKDTVRTLENSGILYCGEGNIAFYRIRGLTLACMGYTGWSTPLSKRLVQDIKWARERADLVIVSFHWGKENRFYPDVTQKKLGRLAVDSGADIVIGHHPHVIQGIEKYKGKFIVYSLGNFCFGGNRNPSDKDTFIFQYRVTFKDGSIVKEEGRVIPCSISSVNYRNNYQPTPLAGRDASRVFKRILSYSKELDYGITSIDELVYNSI